MKINISARHFKKTYILESFIKDKILSLENFENILSCHVVISTFGKYLYTAESTIHGSHFTFAAKAKSKNMYTSIESMVEKLKSQLKKYKGKRRYL